MSSGPPSLDPGKAGTPNSSDRPAIPKTRLKPVLQTEIQIQSQYRPDLTNSQAIWQYFFQTSESGPGLRPGPSRGTGVVSGKLCSQRAAELVVISRLEEDKLPAGPGYSPKPCSEPGRSPSEVHRSQRSDMLRRSPIEPGSDCMGSQ
jgi:hypothetical protein